MAIGAESSPPLRRRCAAAQRPHLSRKGRRDGLVWRAVATSCPGSENWRPETPCFPPPINEAGEAHPPALRNNSPYSKSIAYTLSRGLCPLLDYSQRNL